MRFYSFVVCVLSVVIAAILSRLILLRIFSAASDSVDGKAQLLDTPVGSALLCAFVFVVVWCAVSFVLVLPLLVARSRDPPK